jgi:trehalose/maltose transport system permease protein
MNRSPFWNVMFYIFVVFIVFQAVFPFYYAIITSFKTGGQIFYVTYWPVFPTDAEGWSHYFDNYKNVLYSGNGTFVRNVWNSVWVSTWTVAVALFLGTTAAYALARVRFRGRKLLLMTILAVSMFPQVAVLAGLFETVQRLGLYNSDWSLIFSYTIFTLPFTVWILTTFMRELPVELEEAAIVDGASSWVIVTRIFLPLMWPALVTTGLLAFIAAWNEYLYALTFTASSNENRTVPVGIALLSGNSDHEIPWGPIMAASVIVTLPLIALVLIFQRKIIAGLTAGSVKG